MGTWEQLATLTFLQVSRLCCSFFQCSPSVFLLLINLHSLRSSAISILPLFSLDLLHFLRSGYLSVTFITYSGNLFLLFFYLFSLTVSCQISSETRWHYPRQKEEYEKSEMRVKIKLVIELLNYIPNTVLGQPSAENMRR